MSIKWLKGRFNKNKGYEEDNIETIRKCEVLYIPCDKIRPNALRSRSNFNEDELVALAYSIKKYGIIEPICVRSTDEEDSYPEKGRKMAYALTHSEQVFLLPRTEGEP